MDGNGFFSFFGWSSEKIEKISFEMKRGKNASTWHIPNSNAGEIYSPILSSNL